MLKSKVLFIMTGSIACYKACHVISRLVQADCEVQVVASQGALQFVGHATLEGLSGRPVVSDMYARGNVMDHIHLMRWADLILVAPATASFINKAAQGVGDDLLQTLFLAHDFTRPFLIAPAMNKSMYSHPVTQKSLISLREMGLQVLDSASGILACGEEGWGRLLEPDLILKEVLSSLTENIIKTPHHNQKIQSSSHKKVLVTAGGTLEPIDTVRAITNLSSGRTGAFIAESLSQMGFDVTLLQSHSSAAHAEVNSKYTFTTFKSLDDLMRNLLSNEDFTHVVHSAAVSDYSLAHIEVSGQTHSPLEIRKLNSDANQMSLLLKKNPKIVNQIKSYSRSKNIQVIAFKLTSQASEQERQQAVQKLFDSSQVDYVVHNDLSEIDITNSQHRFHLHSKESSIDCENLHQLTNQLIQIVAKDIV